MWARWRTCYQSVQYWREHAELPDFLTKPPKLDQLPGFRDVDSDDDA